MSTTTCCLHQLLRPTGNLGISVEGVGDCSKCLPDEDNANCKKYYPIAISMGTVKEN